MNISIEELRTAFRYDAETGVIVWAVQPPRKIAKIAGKVAGCIRKTDGYVGITYRRAQFQAHRLAWALHFGEWPAGDLDHINGCRSDNSIRNLRPCDDRQNQANQRLSVRNRSGIKGVCWNKDSRLWQAGIKHKGRSIHLGLFADKREAGEAYLRKAREIHGERAGRLLREVAAPLRQTRFRIR